MIKIDKFIRTNRKSIKIEINSFGELIVYAPKKSSEETIKKFILSKENWITKNQTFILNNINLNLDIINYNKVLLLGKPVSIVEHNNRKTELKDEVLYVQTNLTQRQKMIRIEKYLKQYLTEILDNRLNYFCNLMQLEPTSIKFSNARKRWGSCDSKGNILFNWRIIMLSPTLLDYIVIHELSHLIEMNHSYDFWCIVSSVMPNWKENRAELKKSNFILELYRNVNP